MVTVFNTRNGYIILEGSHTYVSGNDVDRAFVATSLEQVAKIINSIFNQ
jgi:hypothetical protein